MELKIITDIRNRRKLVLCPSRHTPGPCAQAPRSMAPFSRVGGESRESRK